MSHKIIRLENSPVKYKRFRVILQNGDFYDFGLDTGKTYIDHHDKIKRMNYWARHLGNPTEEYRIKNFIPSASLYSSYLLWGESPNIRENIINLNKHFQ
jgi:hypothetical protein